MASSARTVLGLALAAAVACSSATQAAESWPSGAVSADPRAFSAWRGSEAEVVTRYMAFASWSTMRRSTNARPARGKVNVLGVPLVPRSHRGQLAQCARGAFDGEIRRIAGGLRAGGWAGSWVRLGWEANAVRNNPFPWAATGKASDWVGCYRRWATLLNAGNGAPFRYHWNMANRTSFPGSIDQLYPGAAYVDAIGANYFDRCPPIRTQADWRRNADGKDRRGNPDGPAAWAAYARAKGKPYAIAEWGVGRGRAGNCRRPGFDNPFFIRKMHAFLKNEAGPVAYEAYFNSQGFDLHRPTRNPRAAAAYRRLW